MKQSFWQSFFSHVWPFGIGIIPFILLTSILFLHYPNPWPDEAIFLNTAQTFQKTGVIATSLFGNAIPGLSHHALWYPPLYFYVLSGWIQIQGSSIESIRLLSFLIGLGSLVLVYILAKVLFQKRFLASLGVFLVSINPYFIKLSEMARMDILCLFFSLLSYYSYLIVNKKKVFFFIIPGIFSTLAILTHPLGVIAPTIIVLHVFLVSSDWKKKLVKSLYVIIPIIIAIGIWLASIAPFFQFFVLQNSLQMSLKAQTIPNVIMLMKNNSLWIVLCSIYLVSFGLFIRKSSKNNYFLFIVLGFVISVVFLIIGKAVWYVLYVEPFLTLVLLSVINNLKNRLVRCTWIILVVCLHMAIIFSDTAHGNYYNFTNMMKAHLPHKAAVFSSTIPDPYFDLQENPQLQLYEFPPVPITDQAYEHILNNVDYIIINYLNYDSSQFVVNYINQNTLQVNKIIDSDGYATIIVTLLPRNLRRK